MKMKTFIPALFAAGLICFSNVKSANAFFTTYVTAKGGYEVNYMRETKIEEQFENWNKYVTITNKEGSIPVYVRVKAFCGELYTLSYSGEDWKYVEADGYYYYEKPLYGGETTKALRVFIDNIPVKPEEEQNFNVVVIYETIPVQYDEQNELVSPEIADWSETLSSVNEVESVELEETQEMTTMDGGENNE